VLSIIKTDAVDGAIGMYREENDDNEILPTIHPIKLKTEIKRTRKRSDSFFLRIVEIIDFEVFIIKLLQNFSTS
jgi:hypothetical protein